MTLRVRRIAAVVSVGALVASALTFSSAVEAAPQDVGPIFVNGQAQIVPEFEDPSGWIRQQLWVETEFDTDGDGERDRMHVDVTRPGQTDGDLKVPVVYATSPYYAGTASTQSQYFWNVNHELGQPPPPRTSPPAISHRPDRTFVSNSEVTTWVARGFAVVHSDSPGTGLSEGCPTVGGPNESLAPKAVIDWLNGRAKAYTSVDGDERVRAHWSTGKVGMTGTSYNGTLPLAAATTGVKGLEAIIPIAPNTSYYHYYRSNGLVRNPGGWVGEDIDYLFDYISSGYPQTRQYCIDTIRTGEMNVFQDRVSGDYNEFWAGRDYLNQLDDVKAATLMAHAFNDWNVVPEHSVRISEALKGQVPLVQYFHQGGHGGAPPLEMMNLWFSRFLYGVENGIEDDPRRAWIAREGDNRLDPTPYADYPNPEAAPVELVLQPGGATAGGLTSLALPVVAEETFVDAGNTACNAGWLATQPNENRLLYTTPVLSDNLHISGTPEVTVRLVASKPAANLSVALVRLPWTSGTGCNSSTRGTTTSIITRGWADPQNHSSLTEGEPLVPGEFYDVTFPLQPDDQVIPAGSRLGLMVFSTDHEFTIHPAPGTELTVDVAGTSVELPVVGGPLAMPVCEAVDTRETVFVGEVDSGVPNRALAGNCTINDHILDGEPWSNHGLFVDHVTDISSELLAAGVIDNTERAALIRAAAMSRVGR